MRYPAPAVLLLFMQLFVTSCQMPPAPPEVSLVESQEQALWKDGGEIYADAELRAYSQELREARTRFLKEQNRFAWLVDYGRVQEEFAELFTRGGNLREQIETEKERRRNAVISTIAEHEKRAASLAALAGSINEGRVARSALTRGEVLLAEARALLAMERYQEAMSRLADGAQLQLAGEALRKVAGRYADRKQITSWQLQAEQAREDSRKHRGICILVNKLDRTLVILKGGVEIRKYDIGLGRNGLNDKSYAGDQATPEGHYQVIKMVPDSRFYRALLINYPNEDDRKRFATARKSGQIPATASIGALLEIHGGGREGITDGCVSLDNEDMAEIFEMAGVGTRVTIVGTVNYENIVSSVLE